MKLTNDALKTEITRKPLPNLRWLADRAGINADRLINFKKGYVKALDPDELNKIKNAVTNFGESK